MLSVLCLAGVLLPAPDRLMIVAPNSLHNALAPFVEHKRAQLAVELVSLEKALAAKGPRDDPEKLKRHVFDGWKRRGVKYLLLVGDADVMPVRYMVLDRITAEAFDYIFYPSDLYYGDLAKRDGSFEDWNGSKDGFHASYFGEVRGEKNKKDPINFDKVDYIPEIGVGRWPASTPAQVTAIANKTIAYEKGVLSGSAKGMRKAAMIGVDGWVDCRSMMDDLAKNLPPGWTAEKRYGKPSRKDVVDLLNGGLSLIFHTGHGWDDGWEHSFSSNDLPSLSNGAGLPIMFSAGCSTGRFATLPPYEPYEDIHGKAHAGTTKGEVFKSPPPPPSCYAKREYNKSGLGEKVVLLPNAGAVAYIGCNTGSQPAALDIMDQFVWGIANGAPRLGDAWKHAVTEFYHRAGLERLTPTESWYPPSIFFQAMKFMVYGDPSTPLPGPVRFSWEVLPGPGQG